MSSPSSSPPLELFVLRMGPYPRRVLIYLSEKGLLGTPQITITPVTVNERGEMHAPRKPPGTLPILVLPDGTHIQQSLAILQYFEDIISMPRTPWQRELATQAAAAAAAAEADAEEEMRAKARIRETLALADEASSLVFFACHKGTKLFSPMEEQSREAARLALEHAGKNLDLLEGYYEGRFVAEKKEEEEEDRKEGGGEEETEMETATVADCVLFSTMQFMKEFYGRDLTTKGGGVGRPNLRRFYEAFGQRESARLEEGLFPEDLKELAMQWL